MWLHTLWFWTRQRRPRLGGHGGCLLGSVLTVAGAGAGAIALVLGAQGARVGGEPLGSLMGLEARTSARLQGEALGQEPRTRGRGAWGTRERTHGRGIVRS